MYLTHVLPGTHFITSPYCIMLPPGIRDKSLSKYSRGFLNLDFSWLEILKVDNFNCFCAAFVKPGFPLIKSTQILQKQTHHQSCTSETANHYYILITSQSKDIILCQTTMMMPQLASSSSYKLDYVKLLKQPASHSTYWSWRFHRNYSLYFFQKFKNRLCLHVFWVLLQVMYMFRCNLAPQ